MAIPDVAIPSVASVAAFLRSASADYAYLTPPMLLAFLLLRLQIEAKVEEHDTSNGSPDENALLPLLPTRVRDTHVVPMGCCAAVHVQDSSG